MAKKSKGISISTSRQFNLFSGKQDVVVEKSPARPLPSTENNVPTLQEKTSAIATSQVSGHTAEQSTTNEFAGLQCHAFDLLNALWLYRQQGGK